MTTDDLLHPDDTLTVSTEPPVELVEIIKESNPPGYPERAAVPKPGLAHWLEQGWQLVDAAAT